MSRKELSVGDINYVAKSPEKILICSATNTAGLFFIFLTRRIN
jgi:hypothetical protein